MADSNRFTFPKSERLRHKALIDPLFAEGKSVYEYPFRMVYRGLSEKELEDSFKVAIPDKIAPLQVMITVPKKKRRHAVDRVLMRRRIREAWRLQRRFLRKEIESDPKFRTVSVALIYISDENIDSARIHSKIARLLSHLSDTIR